MKNIAAIFILMIWCFTGSAQFYFRGEVKDVQNNGLTNARIVLHSNQYVYHSGMGGAFGITSEKPKDSITITLEGYVSQSVILDASTYAVIILKSSLPAPVTQTNRLLSFTKNLPFDKADAIQAGNESYSNVVKNQFVSAQRFPETGFALNTDKASYSNIRRFLNMNSFVPEDAVRPEEMLNYFNLGYIQPPTDSTFSFHSYISDCPWNDQNKLLFLQVSAKKIDPRSIPPSNLVFLVDVSGSMDMPNRLPLLKSAFKLLVENLRAQDTISIVVYGSTTGVWLRPTSGEEKDKIRKAIEELTPVGSTPGESGIRSAYRVAKSQFITNGNNRVILATDGDFNVGQSTEDELEVLITQHQQMGIYLTCLGVGMGNYKDSKLEILAKKGNGNFAYLDSEKEAEKVLVKEFTQTLYTVADDVYLNIRFNPKAVEHYRLIGYDNKYKALTDSLSKMEGGEIGSGQNTMVLFEISPYMKDGYSIASGDLKAGVAEVEAHFKTPYDSSLRLSRFTCENNYISFDELPSFYRFASAVAMFGELLRDSKFVKSGRWNDINQFAKNAVEPNDAIQQEFILLVEKAAKIYRKRNRR